MVSDEMGRSVPLQPIDRPYLLVLFSVPFYLDPEGHRYIDPLWAQDLAEHTKYISRLTLAACAISGPAPSGFVRMDSTEALSAVRCVHLPKPKSIFDFRALLRLTRTLWATLSQTELVHSSLVGWPVPEAWLLVPMLWFKARTHIIVVESATWRTPPGVKVGARRRVRAAVSERLNRLCIEQADLAFFTQSQYMRSLMRRAQGKGLVVEASWVDAETVLDDVQVQAAVTERSTSPLKLAFAGRLVDAKGPLIAISAVSELVRRGHFVTLDIYGSGDQMAACRELIRQHELEKQVTLCGFISHGSEFLSALRKHDLVLVPSISDEQPRIVYDAYSQGVPIVASDTSGLRQCVTHGITGYLFQAGSSTALASSIVSLMERGEDIVRMSFSCAARARHATHQAMHLARWQAIRRLLVESG